MYIHICIFLFPAYISTCAFKMRQSVLLLNSFQGKKIMFYTRVLKSLPAYLSVGTPRELLGKMKQLLEKTLETD